MMKGPSWIRCAIYITIGLVSLAVCILFFYFGVSSICHSVNCCKNIKISEKEYFVLTKENIKDKGDFKYRKKILTHKDVDEIPPFTFCGNYYLEKIEFLGEISVYESAFLSCPNLKEVVFHNKIIVIGENAFAECKQLKEITLTNGVTEISDGTFNDCKALEKIDLPDSVQSIGKDAFKGCTSLASITIPKSVTNIGENAFADCISLKDITMPVSIADTYGSKPIKITLTGTGEIKQDSFEDRDSITEIVISDGITVIGKNAFKGCTSLATITIPKSVTSIGENTFDGCKNLCEINYTGTKAEWIKITFGNNWKKDVPAKVVTCSEGTENLDSDNSSDDGKPSDKIAQ